MISQLPKSPVARFTAGLLTGLMLLVGPPLEALQGHVVLVPRESPPEWLAPWLESSWLEVDSWQGRWEQAGGAVGGVAEGGVPASRRPTGDPGFSPWAQFLTPLRGAAFQALGAVSAFSGAAFSATDLATSGPDNQLEIAAEKSVESGQRELPLRRVERQARKADTGSLPALRSVESAVVASPPQRIAAASHAIAPEIVALAESLGNSPAAIYAAVYVPGTLRVKVLSLGGEAAEVPANRQVQAEVKVRSRDGQLLSWTGPVSSTVGHNFELRWRGATSADQATLDLYGGVFAAPPYEVDLAPELRLGSSILAVGSRIGSAEDAELSVTWTPPGGQPEVAIWDLFAGEHGALFFDFGRTSQESIDHSCSRPPAARMRWALSSPPRRPPTCARLASTATLLRRLRWQRVLGLGAAVFAAQRGAVSTNQ